MIYSGSQLARSVVVRFECDVRQIEMYRTCYVSNAHYFIQNKHSRRAHTEIRLPNALFDLDSVVKHVTIPIGEYYIFIQLLAICA